MGYAGKIELQNKARSLREQGMSVREIQKKLKVSKSSISLWVRDIELTSVQLRRLYSNKKTGLLKGSIIAALNKKKRRELLTSQIKSAAKKEIGEVNQRDIFLAGIALYFAEGNKADKAVAITNSDPRIIHFMMNWFRRFCKFSEHKFRCALYLHDDQNEKTAKAYWSKLTGIPLLQFTKTYLVKNNPHRLRKTKHREGILRVTISDVNMHRKIMGWISGVFEI